MGARLTTRRCARRSSASAWRRAATRRCARCRRGSAAALWVLDEPYDALDVDGLQVVNELLRAHLARGGSVLLTSHQHPGADAPAVAEFDLDPFS